MSENHDYDSEYGWHQRALKAEARVEELEKMNVATWSRHVTQEAFDIETARVERLSAALRDLYGLVDSGWLVRDVSRDHEDGWGMKQLRPVMILKEVAALVGDAAALENGGKP